MPRPSKLRKKNGYWMTKAGGKETYFGKVSDVPYADARDQFREHLGSIGDKRTRKVAVTCDEVCDRHLDWLLNNRSKALYSQRRTYLTQWCNFVVGQGSHRSRIGDLSYTQVNAKDLLSWRRSLQASDTLEDASVEVAISAVKSCWKWAADNDDGPLPDDFRPFSKIEKLKLAMKALNEEELLTDAEIALLLLHADDDLDSVRATNGHFRMRKPEEHRQGTDNPYAGFCGMLRCYYATGARTGELAACRVRDFLKRTRQVVLGKHKRSTTMKEPTLRRITLNDEAFAMFERQCTGKASEEFIFKQPCGSPWNKDMLDKRFRRVRELAKVRDSITVYSFRHLWISEALMAGNDVATVAKMAGTSIRMIERVYGHFRNQHFEEAQRKLDESRKRKKSPS